MSAASSAARTVRWRGSPTGCVGSPEIYGHKQREAEQSINFVTCHDGFTLNDLVSYNQKHNEANGEDNRDGADDNRSWNCGVEGPTDDPAVEKLRNRQVKNFLTVTMLSLGMPMILMGDEVRRTQRGNNNAYCQDNETSWFDWTLVDKHADVHRFVTLLNARRTLREWSTERQRMSLNQLIREAKKAWHGVKLDQPDWGHWSHSLAFSAEIEEGSSVPRDPERILGAARIRAAAGGRRRRNHGGGGSTRRSTRRTTSFHGRTAADFRVNLSGRVTLRSGTGHRSEIVSWNPPIYGVRSTGVG